MTVVWLSCPIWQEFNLIFILRPSSFTKWHSNLFLNNVLTILHLLWASLKPPRHFGKPEIGLDVLDVGHWWVWRRQTILPSFNSSSWHSDEMFPDAFGFIPHIYLPIKAPEQRRPVHKTWRVIGRTFWRSQSKRSSQIIAEFRDVHVSKSCFLLETKDKLIGSEIL